MRSGGSYWRERLELPLLATWGYREKMVVNKPGKPPLTRAQQHSTLIWHPYTPGLQDCEICLLFKPPNLWYFVTIPSLLTQRTDQWFPGTWREEIGYNCERVQRFFFGWYHFLGFSSGDGRTTLWIYWKPLNHIMPKGEFYSMWIASQLKQRGLEESENRRIRGARTPWTDAGDSRSVLSRQKTSLSSRQ